MNLNEVNKPIIEGEVVVYAGRFQPFHRGHYDAYQRLVDEFGSANVYIATSNDTSSDKSPFSFNEKKEIATKMFGVPSTKFIKVNNPYRPAEILKKYDGQTIAYIAAVGDKDASRLQGKYFKPYRGKAGYGYDEIGYTYPIPAEKNPISGTDVRNGLGSGDKEKAKKFFLKAYPKFDKDIFKMITTKLSEGFPGGIGVGLNLPGGYINGAPTGSVTELVSGYELNPYDPIAELLNQVVTEELFQEFTKQYFTEESEAEKMGLVHLGGGYYSTGKDKPATHKSDNGKIRTLTPAEAEAEKQKKMATGPSDAPANEPKPSQPGQPVNKGATAQGKTDTEKEKSAQNKPGEEKQEVPPEQKLSGAELKSAAEMSPEDKKVAKTKEALDTARKEMSPEDSESIDKVNNPQSEERKGAINSIKKAASYIAHGIKHVIDHNVEMMVGTGRAIKSIATTGKIGSIKDKDGNNVHWNDYTQSGSAAEGWGPKMKEVPVYKKDKHGHDVVDKDGNKVQDKNILGKPKTKKEPVYREDLTSEEKELAEKSWKESQRQKSGIKNLAKTTALIVGSIAVTGGIMGAGAAAAKGGGLGAMAQGAGAKIAAKFGGGHLGSYIMKDIVKHSAAEALGANATQASGAGIALGVAGIFENKNGEDGFDTKKFVPNFMKKTLEIMQNYKLSDEQLLKTIEKYKKEGNKNQSMANASDLMKENISESKQQSIQHFVEFATKRLKLKENPKISLVAGKEYGNVKSSLGGFDPMTKEIYVATENRLTADILRTLAHEMVHRKQDELGLVRNPMKDGADGSPIENQAHAVAGILMREYGRINKQIYNEDINIDVDKGDEVLMGKFKNKKVVVKDLGKDGHGMPTINGKVATTFRMGQKGQNIYEMGNKDVHFMNVIKLYRNATFRKRIHAYLFGRANMPANPNMVARALRNMGYDEITQMEKELNIQPNLNESLLLEGGAYGHMSHPFDDMDLTFGDLKNIITKALTGELGVIREKTDGQALAISWKNGRLIAARNKGHLQNAGANALGIEGVASKFAGRGGLTDAYNFAMKDLSAAISSLSQKQREKIFGEGKNFMNIEVIWPTSVNVIPYGQALLVFHNCIQYNESGVASGQVDGAENILAGMIKQINQQVQSKYTIQGPPITSIPKNDNLSSKQGKYLSKLNKLQSEFGLSDSDNVADYHQSWWDWWITSNAPVKVDKLTKESLIRRWAFGDKSLRLNTISNEELQKWAIAQDKVNVIKQQKNNIRPFEELFLGVGADVLEFVSSVLTVHPDKAIRSMKEKLKQVASQVRSGGDQSKVQKLKQELSRLNALGGIDKIVASEGLVFFYNGKTYKLTGTFAPLNQILGIFYE
jgi:hypothetical protein